MLLWEDAKSWGDLMNCRISSLGLQWPCLGFHMSCRKLSSMNFTKVSDALICLFDKLSSELIYMPTLFLTAVLHSLWQNPLPHSLPCFRKYLSYLHWEFIQPCSFCFVSGLETVSFQSVSITIKTAFGLLSFSRNFWKEELNFVNQKCCELLPYRYKDLLPVYLFWKHLCLNLTFQSIDIWWPVVISERRKPTHLTRGSPDTISELSKELLLHLTLLFAVCFVGKSLQLINLQSPCLQLHSLHYEKYAEISTAGNLQINTEVGREISNFVC